MPRPLRRDLADTVYSPQKAPQVGYFAGTALAVEHPEKHRCPSFTSAELTGKPAFPVQGREVTRHGS